MGHDMEAKQGWVVLCVHVCRPGSFQFQGEAVVEYLSD